ncbi:hypothetical protein PV04_04416 [Phialophora macrospora]|uniref:Uncharacterized protein n=1 Tax=Phialophora macrospora TaxID=1851006 RepID=A0A0D2G9A5_9EURO|nr:hypothetical protein PV04_04416 [Phialophora macrospora]
MQSDGSSPYYNPRHSALVHGYVPKPDRMGASHENGLTNLAGTTECRQLASTASNAKRSTTCPAVRTTLRSLNQLALNHLGCCHSKMIIRFHGFNTLIEPDHYLQVCSLACETLLDPYPEIKALGRWIKYYSLRGSLRIMPSTRAGFEVCLSETLHTTSKVQRTFRIHMDVFGPLAHRFAIPLPQTRRNCLHAQHGAVYPKVRPSREAGITATIKRLAISHALKAQILEEYYQIFLSKRRITPIGHAYGCDSGRTPQPGAEPPPASQSETNNGKLSSATLPGARTNDNDADEDTTVSRKRIRKTADEKEAELRCPEAAVGRGYAKCLTYSTRQVHRLKSDHLMPDHQFQRHALEIGRGKRGETEEHKWVRLFLKLNPDWNTNPPSPYYSANYQTLQDFGTFLRGEAEHFRQAGFRALAVDRGLASEPGSNVDNLSSQSPAPVNQLSHQPSILNDFSVTPADERPKEPHDASLDEQAYSLTGSNVADYHSSLLPVASSSSRSLRYVPRTSSTNSSRTSLSRLISGSSMISSVPSSHQAFSSAQPSICRCKKHSPVCQKLQNARPRSETCQGCQGLFSWSDKATPYIVSSDTPDSVLCRCESHYQECIFFMDKYDAGKCTCCDGWMPFSDRATPLILPASKSDTGASIDENDFSDMMNWDAPSL